MTEVSKKKQAEQEGAARKSKAAGRVIMDRKDAGLMKAGGSGNARKAANELARAGVKVGGGRKTAAKRNKPRRSEKDGAEMLRQESDQALVEISQHEVSKLKAGAKEGDVVCVKALMSFSEKKKPREKPKKPNGWLKLIEELHNEPQWVDPEPWGPGAPGFGGGKPV